MDSYTHRLLREQEENRHRSAIEAQLSIQTQAAALTLGHVEAISERLAAQDRWQRHQSDLRECLFQLTQHAATAIAPTRHQILLLSNAHLDIGGVKDMHGSLHSLQTTLTSLTTACFEEIADKCALTALHQQWNVVFLEFNRLLESPSVWNRLIDETERSYRLNAAPILHLSEQQVIEYRSDRLELSRLRRLQSAAAPWSRRDRMQCASFSVAAAAALWVALAVTAVANGSILVLLLIPALITVGWAIFELVQLQDGLSGETEAYKRWASAVRQSTNAIGALLAKWERVLPITDFGSFDQAVAAVYYVNGIAEVNRQSIAHDASNIRNSLYLHAITD